MPAKRTQAKEIKVPYRTKRREAAWRELDKALAQVHARTQSFSDQEIQADITAARQEVREQRHTLRNVASRH